jgi:transcription elongation factor GreA
MMNKTFRLTKDGIAELQAELQSLLRERGSVAERIKTAREFGDLSENAEYSAARAEQDKNEARIAEIERILQNAELIDKSKANGAVVLGATVKLRSSNGKTKEFQVVGTVEADPLNGKISDESPIGKELLGKKIGDEITIKMPAETTVYKIVEIS